MTVKEIKYITKLMRAEGILSLKMDGLELVLNPNHKPKVTPAKEKAFLSEDKLPNTFQGYSEEELMLWSTKSEGA